MKKNVRTSEAPAATAVLTRRAFGMGAGAVTLMGFWACSPKGEGAVEAKLGEALSDPQNLIPSYIQVTADNDVVIVCPAAEMGQGVMTSLAALIAEEMEADWDKVRVAQSSAGEVYINPGKNLQATGRSMSVRGYFEKLRTVGAEAKARLIAAAAESWDAPPGECAAADSMVIHSASGRSATFAELAERAAAYEEMAPAPLKPHADYKILGKSFLRKDLTDKVTGKAVFGLDIEMPGQLVATLAMAPTLGGELTSFDEAAAMAVAGVKHVVPTIEGEAPGLAVVADTFWQAQKGLAAAAPVFSDGPYAETNSADLMAAMKETLNTDGRIARDDGGVEEALASAPVRLSGVYEAPYLAHASMEPLTCAAHVRADGCMVIAPTQGPIRLRDLVAERLGFQPAQVDVQRVYLGGAFGRRWQPDFALQAVEISKACGAPVKLIWSREADMQHDYYRPQAALSFEAGLDEAGDVAALRCRSASASIMEWGRPDRLQGRADFLAMSGVTDNPYAFGKQKAAWTPAETPVPVGVWRSVGHSQNGFFMEGLVDEIAIAAGADPLLFRKERLADHPRMTAVLDAVADLAAWRGAPTRDARGQGVAIADAYGSVCAYVIDVEVIDKAVSIENVACVIDCGFAVSPDGVRAQMEGNVIFALTAALYGHIDIENGAVVQSNYHDYEMARLAQTPPISVEILESDGPLGGAGEPGFPPFAPALVNAIYAATGERLRSLPLTRHGYALA